MEEISGGAVQRRYAYGPRRISETQLLDGTWTSHWYGYDGEGHVRSLTEATGAVTDTHDYDAFGNVVGSAGTTPNAYRYRGEQWDADLGLYYLRARWYNPATGRFLSRDPPDTGNKYAYAAADPVNGSDPTGMFAEYGILSKNSDAAAATAPFEATVVETAEGTGTVTKAGADVLCILRAAGSLLESAIVFAMSVETGAMPVTVHDGACLYLTVAFPMPVNPFGPDQDPGRRHEDRPQSRRPNDDEDSRRYNGHVYEVGIYEELKKVERDESWLGAPMADENEFDLAKRAKLLHRLGIATLPAIWLRPYTQSGVAPTASKIGGLIAWPDKVPWPVCNGTDASLSDGDVQNDFFVPLAQFRRDEYSEIRFPGDSSILQILWCPRLHEDSNPAHGLLGPKIQIFWHRLEDLRPHVNPTPRCANPYLLPNECGLRPLQLDDALPWWLLNTQQQADIEAYQQTLWRTPDTGGRYRDLYLSNLGTIPGTKLLGCSNEQDEFVNRTCACGRLMGHLLSVGSTEVDPSNGEWYRRYGPELKSEHTHRAVTPIGLDLLDGSVQIFYCETCPHRPIATQWING